jgi:hypothetical protein
MHDYLVASLASLICMLVIVSIGISLFTGLYSAASLGDTGLTAAVRMLPGASKRFTAVGADTIGGMFRAMPTALRRWFEAFGVVKPAPKPALSELESAYAVLGFNPAELLTREALMARAREMRSTVHPDKGFPNHVFVQMINDAVNTIKAAKRWR